MTSIAHELEKARRNLLDLTMRNRLLNYRPNKTKSIRVVDEDPAEIFDALTLRERKLEFRGTGPKKKDAAVADETKPEPIFRSTTWTRLSVDTLQNHHTDKYLQTPHDDESLEKKLFHIYHEGNTVVEEQGYTVVHIAIGFLEWYEADDAQTPRRAPLLLIPAELERVAAGDFSRISWTGEDVFMNISLAAKLLEQGVRLPAFEPPEEKEGINNWLSAVVEAIAKKPTWRVLSDVVLDFFSFSKFVMFKDLDAASWPEEKKPEDHPLLRSLFAPDDGANTDSGFDENTIDQKLTARDLHHVMDADPSQIAVIEDVKAARNLVVEGPPGTGKSQTITNVIAEALAAGKTVLFVSEKMAALEVVKNRLDAAGLGPFCLELHRRKANKKALLEELRRSLESTPPNAPSDRLLEEHEGLKHELNSYAEALGQIVGETELTPWDLISLRERAVQELTRLGVTTQVARFSGIERCSASAIDAARQQVRTLATAFTAVAPTGAHPWRESTRTQMLPHEQSDLAQGLDVLTQNLRAVETAVDRLVTEAGVTRAETPTSIERACHAAEVLSRASGTTEAAVLLSSAWNSPSAESSALIGRVRDVQARRAALQRAFAKESFIDAPVAAQLHEFRELAAKLFRIFSSRYRELRRSLVAEFRNDPGSNRSIVAELESLSAYQHARESLRRGPRGAELFGQRWKGEHSNADELTAFADWVVAFRRELLSRALSDRAVDIVAANANRESVSRATADLRQALSVLEQNFREFVAEAGLDGSVWNPEQTLDEIRKRVETWRAELPRLFEWTIYLRAMRELRGTFAAPIEPPPDASQSHAQALLPLFHAAVADALLRVAYSERPTLGSFDGSMHEQKIARFREIDADLVRINRARLSRKLHASRPTIAGGVSRASEAGILLSEFQRRRGHMPIRKLLANAGTLVQRMKPCFLMSPLSVAQFLDAKAIRFDLIVFDEASQVRPEDALGALLRGTQLVVMGDTQQLPPTSFFDHLVEDEADEDSPDVTVADVESVLHQCARSYPSKRLNWHYRSRHESLIAISNLHFYENGLRIYPSAMAESDDLGLHFVHDPESVYDRGKSATNLLEAKAVARAAVDHYRKRGHSRSLGVGTFNIKQQQAILEEIELQLKANPEMEPYFKAGQHEQFFVKNLETIQGDERDVIFISVGYGRDVQGRLSLNFGPLNRERGERRLNVLISRAREKCVVFSNFTFRDLALEATSSRGLFALKSFLEFAETGRMPVEGRPLEESDSPFEDSVMEVLRSRGYEVRPQVGCAGFRVDIGVIDPKAPGSYLLGVECDGAKYHSAPVARDRDRLRQQLLEQLGWRIHRIWSTDWYRNKAQTIDRLLLAVETAKNTPRPVRADAAMYDAPVKERIEIRESQVVSAESWLDAIPPYETCSSLSMPMTGELHEQPMSALATAVVEVVDVEGPVHIDEVIRRIRTIWGVARAGNRIRESIVLAAKLAANHGRVQLRGDFLWKPQQEVKVRRRSVDPPPKIQFISDEEIATAIQIVLKTHYSLPETELVIQASRALGWKLTSADAAERILQVRRASSSAAGS